MYNKNVDILVDFESMFDNKTKNRAYDAKVTYLKKLFGHKFVNYLGPTNFDLMPINIKKIINLNILVLCIY